MPTAVVQPLTTGERARVIAVVRAIGLDAVMEQLAALDPQGVLIEQVRGYGRQKGHLEHYDDGGARSGTFLPKVRLEFTVSGERLQEAVSTICGAARTGRIGDGKIFVHAVEPIALDGNAPQGAAGAGGGGRAGAGPSKGNAT